MLITPLENEHPLDLLHRCGGYYKVPKSKDGKRLGKLVPYTGTYGYPPLNYVGEEYANYAAIEQQPQANERIASRLVPIISVGLLDDPVICGVPTGGLILGLALAQAYKYCRFVQLEKKITASPEKGKEDYILQFGRHSISPGEVVVLVEDIVNNAKNTGKAIKAIESAGGKVTMLACFLNRSVTFDNKITMPDGSKLEVRAVVRKPILQFRQDDPFVAEDVRAGRICWHVKNEWSDLMESMKLDQ